jgi:protein-tyrosine phosphatase
MKHYSILFVCNDNLCRSPTAEVVLRQKLTDQGLHDRVKVESAGTHDYNVEEQADIRSQKHATRRGYDLSGFRARLLLLEDFERFDLILAMDASNMQVLQMRCPPSHKSRLQYFSAYLVTPRHQSVPDPFYGDERDFELVLDQIEEGCDAILKMAKQAID